MKILLINPPLENIILTTQPRFVVSEKGSYPPLGLLYLATMVKTSPSHEVEILDCQLEKVGFDGIRDKIIQYRPDIVGITLITFMLIDAFKVAAIARECAVLIKKDITIVGGGPHASIFPEETIRQNDFDFVFSGESEFSFLEFINKFEARKDVSQIKGIYFKKEGVIRSGPANDFIADLNSIPIPDRSILDYKKYKTVLSGDGLMTTSITSRGCPYGCIFCDRLGKKFRAVSAENVVSEIEHCLGLGIREIFFHDDTFTVDKARVMDICRLIKDKKLKFVFSLRSRVNTIDEDMIRALKQSGCQRISFGVESGVQHILLRIKKGITLNQVEIAFRLAKRYGITTLADFMIGHPGESISEVMETMKFAIKLNPDYAQFSITTPYPATELYRQALTQGVIKSDVWREFASNPSSNFMPPRWDEFISREKLDYLLSLCYRRFYLRPSYIMRQLFQIKSLFGLVKRGRIALGLINSFFKNNFGSSAKREVAI